MHENYEFSGAEPTCNECKQTLLHEAEHRMATAAGCYCLGALSLVAVFLPSADAPGAGAYHGRKASGARASKQQWADLASCSQRATIRGAKSASDKAA